MNQERITRVIDAMHGMGLRQVLISTPASIYYLTGKWIFPGERMLALYLNDQRGIRLYANRLFALSGTVDVPLTEYDDTEDCVRILAEGIQPGPIGIDKF